MKSRLMKISLIALLLFAGGSSFADSVPTITTKDAFGESIWNQLKDYYYQTLFDKLGDINTSIYSSGNFNIHLSEGRLLLSQDAMHLMLVDHFGLNAQDAVPIGSVLSFGGNLGAYLMRIRQIPMDGDYTKSVTLKEDLADWNPKAKLADPTTYQQNIGPWIDAISAEVRAGKTDDAKALLGDETPAQQYLDILAGLKLPFEMPWTAKRLLDNKKVLLGDLESFVAQGGIFFRIGGDGIGWNSIAGPWAGVFLNGQFRFGIFKETDQKFLLRVDSERNMGFNYNLFDDDFRIPLGHGLVFGHEISPHTSIRPFTAAGISYDSKLFARTYQLDFSFAGVDKAYDAALHGNLTVLDDMAKAGGQGVTVMSERYNNGHYNQSQFQIALGPIQINNMYSNANVEEKFWDKRGTFDYFNANSLRSNYTDVNLLVFSVRQTRTNNLTTEAYPVAPNGPFAPRLTWGFDEVNFHATKDDQTTLQTFIESLKPSGHLSHIDLSKYSQFHASFQIQVHPAGIVDFENHSVDQVWQAAAQILFNNAAVWQNAQARQNWLDANPDNTDNYDQVDHWASAFAHKPAATDLKKWFANLIEWQRSTYWDALGVRLFLSLVAPEHRYINLQFLPETGSPFTFTDGTSDTTAYPDDWEYLTIPDIQPQVPPLS